MNRPSPLRAVNTIKKWWSGCSSLKGNNCFKASRFASEATNDPRPPILTPKNSADKWGVKFASKMAAGTLLMTWLVISPVI